MSTERGYEVRLFETWPPDSVTFNGQTVVYNADPDASAGWRYDGDSLTTIIPASENPVTTAVKLT